MTLRERRPIRRLRGAPSGLGFPLRPPCGAGGLQRAARPSNRATDHVRHCDDRNARPVGRVSRRALAVRRAVGAPRRLFRHGARHRPSVPVHADLLLRLPGRELRPGGDRAALPLAGLDSLGRVHDPVGAAGAGEMRAVSRTFPRSSPRKRGLK